MVRKSAARTRLTSRELVAMPPLNAGGANPGASFLWGFRCVVRGKRDSQIYSDGCSFRPPAKRCNASKCASAAALPASIASRAR